jgi:hypothetical protein
METEYAPWVVDMLWESCVCCVCVSWSFGVLEGVLEEVLKEV